MSSPGVVEGPEYVYQAKVLRVVDGDTLDLLCDLGFRTFKKVRVRLHGVNTPEMFGVKKESEEYQRGQAAAQFVRQFVGTEPDPVTGLPAGSGEVVIRSHDGKPLGQGKYGRWLCEVFTKDANWSLNEALVRRGFAEAVSY